MAVDPEITKQYIREELALAKDLAVAQKWGIIPNYEQLTVLVTMYAHNGELFIVEVRCDDYKENPHSLSLLTLSQAKEGRSMRTLKRTTVFSMNLGRVFALHSVARRTNQLSQLGPTVIGVSVTGNNQPQTTFSGSTIQNWVTCWA